MTNKDAIEKLKDTEYIPDPNDMMDCYKYDEEAIDHAIEVLERVDANQKADWIIKTCGDCKKTFYYLVPEQDCCPECGLYFDMSLQESGDENRQEKM